MSSLPFGAPKHLNSTGCSIKSVEGRGRGVYAERFIPRGTLVDISPVLLFEKEEYEQHGKHTVVDHYTYVWPGNRMALALGLGSIFNHTDPPNVSFTLDPATESIRYTTTRDINPGEELCIFYGHKLWFTPTEGIREEVTDVPDDGWGGLAGVGVGVDEDEDAPASVHLPVNPFEDGDPDEVLEEEALPFVRFKPPPDEETADSIRTVEAWVVDVPDPKHLGPLIKWIKQANLESPDVAHLKRIRKNLTTGTTALLLSLASSETDPDHDAPPPLPAHLDLPQPYRVPVPASSALTSTSLTFKSAIWPTMYTPKRKDEYDPWTRGQARWAWDAMMSAITSAIQAKNDHGELPIAAHIAAPYRQGDEGGGAGEGQDIAFTAHDTRTSTAHPLRHAAINAIRKLADYHATHPPSSSSSQQQQVPSPPHTLAQDQEHGVPENEEDASATTSTTNGTNYLLTNRTIFLTHEPCIMCSMALLHSRVKDLFYLIPMPATGACGSGPATVCLPTLKGVNHRFAICRWNADGDIIASATTTITTTTTTSSGKGTTTTTGRARESESESESSSYSERPEPDGPPPPTTPHCTHRRIKSCCSAENAHADDNDEHDGGCGGAVLDLLRVGCEVDA